MSIAGPASSARRGRHPAGRERDPRPDHHRPGHAGPVRRARLRRLAGLGRRCTGATSSSSSACTCSPGSGITVGFHRHLTHRSFKTQAWLHGLLAILGSAAIEGPVISWVADHRKHHAFSDEEGDPHSPHVDHGHGWSGAMRGLFHAHMGWLFIHTQRGNKERFAPDLIKDPVVSWVDRTFLLWAIARPAAPVRARLADRRHPLRRRSPACSGAASSASSSSTTSPTASTRSATSSATATSRPTTSRATSLLAPIPFGEAWHNNHHAFPTRPTTGCAGGRSTSRRW